MKSKSSKSISVLFYISMITLALLVNSQGIESLRFKKVAKNYNNKKGTDNFVLSSKYGDQLNTYGKSGNSGMDVDNNSVTATPASYAEDKCELIINETSKAVFQQILKHHDPRFVQFHIYFSKPVNYTTDVFQPGRWYWTYRTRTGPFQFLSWDISYGLLTFGLLDYKTSLVPFVKLISKGQCNLTVGTEGTFRLIAKALAPVVNFTSAPELPHKYKDSYFCYMAVEKDVKDTFNYHASVYLLFPGIYIDYKCCLLKYNFTDEIFRPSDNCSQSESHMRKWTSVLNFNIILGFVIIAYCPVLFLRIFAWLGESDKIDSDEHGVELIQAVSENDDDNVEDWIFADGKSPLTFFDVISFKGLGIDKMWPIFVSRLRRFLCLILAPSIIYIRILIFSRGIGVWKEGEKITVKDLVDVGTPVGFLSLLGDPSNRSKVFVPALGGPIGISVLYFVLGFFYLVLPKCLKQIFENGLPNSNVLSSDISPDINVDTDGRSSTRSRIKSPLLMSAKNVIKMSHINVNLADLEPGYSKGMTLMRCNVYMLFTAQFWRHVWCIQTDRVSCCKRHRLMCLLSVFYLPIYVAFCLFEVLLCILYFGIPFVFFLIVIVRGAVKLIPFLRERNAFFFFLFKFRFTRGLGVFALFSSTLLFTYCVFLLIVESFKFVSLVISYCFVAIIVFPSVSFGNLFLLVVIVYFIIRQLKFFSNHYTVLLSKAVRISRRISETANHVTCINGHIVISNVTFQNLREIEINGQTLDVSPNSFLNRYTDNVLKLKMKDKSYGIPKDLYSLLIQKYRPVHIQVLSLLLRVFILISCVLLFLSITHSYIVVPEDQISEVMHVVFVIAVGALPKLIETDFFSHNDAPLEKIEEKYIEQAIVEYWTQKRTAQE